MPDWSDLTDLATSFVKSGGNPVVAAQQTQQRQEAQQATPQARTQQAAQIVDAVLQDADPKKIDIGASRAGLITAVQEMLARPGATPADAEKELRAATKVQAGDKQTRTITAAVKPVAPATTTQPAGGGTSVGPKDVLDAFWKQLGQIPADPAERDTWLQTVIQAAPVLKTFHDLVSGIVKLDDGTVITQKDFDQLDPQAQAQVQAHVKNQNIAVINAYNDLMNKHGLDQYKIATDATKAENDRLTADFVNRQANFASNLDLDKAGLARAAQDVTRSVSGLNASTTRANTIANTLMQAAPWGTGGKTEFTPADWGGAMAMLAQQAGIDPNQAALRLPAGTTSINPQGLLDSIDAALGVNRALPETPGLLTNAGMIPQAPALVRNTTPPPSLFAPVPPVPFPVPRPQPVAVGGGPVGLLSGPPPY